MKNVGSTLLFPHLGKKISDSGIATFFYFSSLPQRLHESRDKDEKEKPIPFRHGSKPLKTNFSLLAT